MNVVRMERYRNRDTVEVLEALLAQAKNGRIGGLALTYRGISGEEAIITGSYAQSPDSAAAAALRLSMKLAQSRGEYNHSP